MDPNTTNTTNTTDAMDAMDAMGLETGAGWLALATDSPEPSSVAWLATLTLPQWTAMLAMRRQYRESHDLWNAHELAHLRFLRWLRDAGRLES